VGEAQTFRAGQKPMQAADFQTEAGGFFTKISPSGCADFVDRFSQGEGGNLNPIVTSPGAILQSGIDGPSLENLIADGQLHAGY
jgi:hypothetical protein